MLFDVDSCFYVPINTNAIIAASTHTKTSVLFQPALGIRVCIMTYVTIN